MNITYGSLDEYPIIGIGITGNNEIVPLRDIPQMSDYEWQLSCLKHRMEHPENYKDEDINSTIKRIESWLQNINKEVV